MRAISMNELACVVGGGAYCGPEGSWISNLIPDEPFGFKYGQACKQHDMDYSLGILSKSQADNNFLDSMLKVADGNPIGVIVAYVYYAAVVLFGDSQYNNQGGSQPAEVSDMENFIVEEMAADFMGYNSQDAGDWYDGSDLAGEVQCSWSGMGGGGAARWRDDYDCDPLSTTPPIDRSEGAAALA